MYACVCACAYVYSRNYIYILADGHIGSWVAVAKCEGGCGYIAPARICICTDRERERESMHGGVSERISARVCRLCVLHYCKQVPIVVARYIRVSLKYSTSFMVTRYNLNGMARSKGSGASERASASLYVGCSLNYKTT